MVRRGFWGWSPLLRPFSRSCSCCPAALAFPCHPERLSLSFLKLNYFLKCFLFIEFTGVTRQTRTAVWRLQGVRGRAQGGGRTRVVGGDLTGGGNARHRVRRNCAPDACGTLLSASLKFACAVCVTEKQRFTLLVTKTRPNLGDGETTATRLHDSWLRKSRKQGTAFLILKQTTVF